MWWIFAHGPSPQLYTPSINPMPCVDGVGDARRESCAVVERVRKKTKKHKGSNTSMGGLIEELLEITMLMVTVELVVWWSCKAGAARDDLDRQ